MNFYRSSASFYRTKHNDRVFVPHFLLVDLPAVLFVNRRGYAEAIDIQAFHVSPPGDGCRLLEHGGSDATVAHLRFNKHRGYPWRILRSVHTVVLDDGAATHRNPLDKCNYCIRN